MKSLNSASAAASTPTSSPAQTAIAGRTVACLLAGSSVEVEGSVNRSRQRGLLGGQEVADQAPVIKTVGRPERYLRRQAADRARDGGHRDAVEIRPDQFSGQDHDRPRLVEAGRVDGPHLLKIEFRARGVG